MKKILLALALVLLCAVPALAANYYGCAAVAGANINVSNGWGTASTGSCTCSGAGAFPTLTSSDHLYANGCTGIIVDVIRAVAVQHRHCILMPVQERRVAASLLPRQTSMALVPRPCTPIRPLVLRRA